MALDPQALTGAVAGLGAVGWIVFKSYIEKKKLREAGLPDNPERCTRHEVRLGEIERRLTKLEDDNRVDHSRIAEKLETLSINVARLNGPRTLEK